MASCAASLTASSLSPSSGSGAGAGTDARAADSGEATLWAARLPSSPASTELLGDEPDLAGAHPRDVHLAHERDHGRLDARVALTSSMPSGK